MLMIGQLGRSLAALRQAARAWGPSLVSFISVSGSESSRVAMPGSFGFKIKFTAVNLTLVLNASGPRAAPGQAAAARLPASDSDSESSDKLPFWRLLRLPCTPL